MGLLTKFEVKIHFGWVLGKAFFLFLFTSIYLCVCVCVCMFMDLDAGKVH